MSTPSVAPVVVSRIQNRRGTQTQFLGLYPPGYLGIGGFGSIPGFNITNFPNVLMPGELALCTDSRRIYMGNINGEYIELAEELVNGLFLGPLEVSLPPTAIPTLIPQLTYLATPYTTLLYSATDSPSPDWNTVGVNFSRNGQLFVTAISTTASLVDTSTELNNLLPHTITFSAQYDLPMVNIEIYYTHDFPVNINFNTATIKWVPFA